MTKPELIALCENFQPGDNHAFQKIIAGFCTDDEKIKILCAEFELLLATPARWINGVSRPHPAIQRLIVWFINDELKK